MNFFILQLVIFDRFFFLIRDYSASSFCDILFFYIARFRVRAHVCVVNITTWWVLKNADCSLWSTLIIDQCVHAHITDYRFLVNYHILMRLFLLSCIQKWMVYLRKQNHFFWIRKNAFELSQWSITSWCKPHFY